MKNNNLSVIWILVFVILTSGCDAFVRKFTRKPKKENLPQVEMVLAPEEYKAPVVTSEEVYRKYLLYWKSWQDELVSSLLANTNHKKQLDCASEAVNNLAELKSLLKENGRLRLEAYIRRSYDLKSSIEQDVYGFNANILRSSAERLRRDILRDFSYSKVKEDLV